MTKNDAINMVANFKLNDKDTLWIWILVQIKLEVVQGGTYFRGIYSSTNGKQYKKSWKDLDELKNVD